MASIFTYNDEPPRLSSPWSTAEHEASTQSPADVTAYEAPARTMASMPISEIAMKLSVTKLEAEPQEGPTEYKLHLLLRPRRRLISSSTGRWLAGTQHSRSGPTTPRSSEAAGSSTPVLQYSGSRQHRLEQLTTQLLWRLQQSSPYHTASSDNVILPTLPDAEVQLQAPKHLARLLPGLEDSKGALYEIGVADNGSLVGLTEDEMTESLNNLRAMSGALGCEVRLLRMVEVGECLYLETEDDPNLSTQAPKRGRLYVAEAYIKPTFDSRPVTMAADMDQTTSTDSANDAEAALAGNVSTTTSSKEQLRVSLTGATTSGKSSLLGTLSTSTLDNGRGKSRLSLLKHRHEIASGMTSSVAQELIGYTERVMGNDKETHVINYATGNVSSWDDIHASSDSGRVAFLCDSAGHPRFRRTTVRGLVGWAPHWTLICIAADTSSDAKVQDSPTLLANDDLGTVASIANIAMAHLDLCLKLELPLIVIITKFDAATKQLLREVLSNVLTRLKLAGRKPIMLPNDTAVVHEEDLQIISTSDNEEISKLCSNLSDDPITNVPILFTSALKGTGIGKLHALLRHLPIVRPVQIPAASPSRTIEADLTVLFHVDDTFNLRSKAQAPLSEHSNKGIIISGHLSCGSISIGDNLLLGPFSWATTEDDSGVSLRRPSHAPDDPFLSPRSFGEALMRTTNVPRSGRHIEWITMKVISIRNLRLPVRILQQDQAGTLGLVPVDSSVQDLVIRKGMILAKGTPEAAHAFTAAFDLAEANQVFVGGIVIVYSATMRAAAKVVAVQLEENSARQSRQTSPERNRGAADEESDDGFGFSLDEELEPIQASNNISQTASGILVTFQFLTYREWVQTGAKVLVMPGSGPEQARVHIPGGVSLALGQDVEKRSAVTALDGYVGRVVDKFG